MKDLSDKAETKRKGEYKEENRTSKSFCRSF